MTRQEEVREGITQAVGEYAGTIMVEMPQWVFNARRAEVLVDQILESEDRKGVVIKLAEQILPSRCYFDEGDDKDRELELSGHTQMDMLRAGYVAVESLIDEGVKG